MNRPLSIVAVVLMAALSAPAFGQFLEVNSAEAREAVRTYDDCLVKAAVRAERARTPLELQHGVSIRACQSVRFSLLSHAGEASEVKVALDAVDRIRQRYMDQSVQTAASDRELASQGHAYFMEKLARRALMNRETFSPRSEQVVSSPPARPQAPS